jgi:hypothetical protein
MSARLTDRIAARIESRAALYGKDAGMTTAEYAVGTVAAAGCGSILYKISTSEQFLQVVKAVILKAFRLF